jgi:hypothetical protein
MSDPNIRSDDWGEKVDLAADIESSASAWL